MEWRDRAIILSIRRHGEHHALADVLTRSEGRWRGLVRGGGGRRLAGVLQAGNEIDAHWRARLDAHLGTLTVEPARARAAALMGDPGRLAAMTSICALLELALPEREPHPAVHDMLVALLDLLENREATPCDWGAALVHAEMALLADLGFGLDLACCAATGVTEDLVYVSPRSGRAVSRAAGAPYRDRLLPLPQFLLGRQAGDATQADVAAGLRLTGHFLLDHVIGASNRGLPPARQRLLQRFMLA